MCYNQTGDITTLDGSPLKLVDKLIYLGSSVSSTEKVIDTMVTKPWRANDRLSIIWKSDLSDKMKRSFFQAAVVSLLVYGCTTWTLTQRLEKKLDGNDSRMLRAILNKSWRQPPQCINYTATCLPSRKLSNLEDSLEAPHAIKFCFKHEKNATEMYGMLQTSFGPSCMNQVSVFGWHKRFKDGRESVRDDERYVRSKEVNIQWLIGQRLRVRVTMFLF